VTCVTETKHIRAMIVMYFSRVLKREQISICGGGNLVQQISEIGVRAPESLSPQGGWRFFVAFVETIHKILHLNDMRGMRWKNTDISVRRRHSECWSVV
jgi:hypothetical protein